MCPVRYYRKYQLVKHNASKHPGAQPVDLSENGRDVEESESDPSEDQDTYMDATGLDGFGAVSQQQNDSFDDEALM